MSNEREMFDGARPVAMVALIAAILSLGTYWLTGHIGLDLYDEGYLWYGVQRTAAGDIPIRDFQSYDPGRYYWCAAWSFIFGDGILALRLSTALIQTLGLTCGLLAARRATIRPESLTLIGLVLLAWMFPRYKLFEPSIAMIAVLIVTRLIEKPSWGRHLTTGIFVGFAAVMGRNHGLYCALASLLAIGLLLAKGRHSAPVKNFVMWSTGVVVGFSPVLAFALFAPGFADSFVRSLLQSHPLPIPIPWPWRLFPLPNLDLISTLVLWTISLVYVVMTVAYPLGLFIAWRTPREKLRSRALLIAAVCVGIFYAHHAYSRAGMIHLAQGIHPLLLALFALPPALGWKKNGGWTRMIWASLSMAAALVALRINAQSLHAYGIEVGGNSPETRVYVAAGDRLVIAKQAASDLESLEQTVTERVSPDAPLLILPYRATYYPLLRRRAPVWGIYFLPGGEEESDEQMIRHLEEQGVDWVLYVTERLDGTDRDFPTLRPRFWTYLRTEFEPVQGADLPLAHVLLRRR
jgi:hypothetical protein